MFPLQLRRQPVLLACLSLFACNSKGDPIPPRQPSAAPAGTKAEVQQVFRPALPAADGVIDLTLIELFRQPMGPAGIEISDRARGLAGKQVRLCGYVARQAPPMPWKVLLSPVPVTLHDLEFGLCDDLPATVIRVELPRNLPPVLPPLRHLVAFTGTLQVDGTDEADGRSLPLRLVVDAESFKSFPPLSVTNFSRVAVTSQVAAPDSSLAAGSAPVASQH